MVEAPSPSRPRLSENLAAAQSEPATVQTQAVAEETDKSEAEGGRGGQGRSYRTEAGHNTPRSAYGPSARGTKAGCPHLDS